MASSDLTLAGLELWGGIECTRNRVHDQFHDQVVFSGHRSRPEDIELIAELGIRSLRYPCLWEWVTPTDDASPDWTWPDERLPRIAASGMRPIVGFVHHGSGPQYTSLIDPHFASGLASYARQFAERFPWVEDYTPVNEPLTTARFTTIYGHWYPHRRDQRAFATAMLVQCKATVLSMRAVRGIQPSARLIQTEDLGRTRSTKRLRYQADFENVRRWLTFDLLCGNVDRTHPIGDYFLWLGVDEQDLRWFQDNPCPPDVIGINHYVTSDRYLDDRIDRYPPELVGGNGRDVYVDVEAVRSRPGLVGLRRHLDDAWNRFQIPLAVTEAHLGCTREEQLRWFWEVWSTAEAARKEGIDVRAVTSWALLGSFDWDSLVTQIRGHYEPGAFDVRGGRPRPTALARLLSQIAKRQTPDCVVLDQAGWWRRPERILWAEKRLTSRGTQSVSTSGRPIVIAGAGKLGRALTLCCQRRGLPCTLLCRKDMDIADIDSVESILRRLEPWAVINAAGYARVNAAERDIERCWRENVQGPSVLATACARAGIPMMTFSSDFVFDGTQKRPYREGDRTNPLNVYGRTKAEAEREVTRLHPQTLLIRSSAFFDPSDANNFLSRMLRDLAAGRTGQAAADSVVSPTFLPDLVTACLDLLLDGANGIWHLSNQGEVTWVQFARLAAEAAGLDPEAVEPCPMHHFGWAARRPSYSALGSERAILLPRLEDALARYAIGWRQQAFSQSVESADAVGKERAAFEETGNNSERRSLYVGGPAVADN